MSGLLRLRRLRLLNFHNFVDETLAVRRNVFLIGDNQSGKTTVLDGVHFALSAGVDIEFNAATRFGPRTEPGRSLASIVLRYDLERDEARRGPSVAYAILETEDGDGERCSFGAGAFATSLDSQPDVWGFIARGRSLEDLDLIVAEGDSRRRPRDRQELEEVVGRGNVFEKGRYRSALAQFLFRDREAYLRVLDVLGAAKAYRELVARSRNLNDLFLELLPPPAETEFDEVRSALRAVEGIRGNLAELQEELRVLSRVIEKLGEARQENEKETRYQFVGAELARRRAAEQHARAEHALAAAEQAAREAEQIEQQRQQDADSLETALRALRASQEFALVEREEEARRDLAAEERNRQALEQEAASAARGLEDAQQAAEQARRSFEATRERAARAVRSISDAVRDHLDESALVALGALAEGIAVAEAGVAQPYGRLQHAFQERRDRALEAAARAETQAASLREQAARCDDAADQVRNRAEVLPDLAGYDELLFRLESRELQALPLYRLLELAPGTPESLGAAIECVLGPRTLGAIVAPEEEHTAVRAEVLAHGAGIEVLDPAELAGTGEQSPRDTLPALLAPAELSEAAALAQAYLRRVAGDVRILPAGGPREGRERVIWTDGYIYDLGAESRVDAGAPRFLGAEARRRAAAAEEQRWRAEAERRRAEAVAAAEEALAQREVARICSICLDELRACSPDTLLRAAGERNHAAGIVAEREESLERSRTRLASAAERCRERKLRHEQIVAALQEKGLLDLRSRLARLEGETDAARSRLREARDELVRRQEAAQVCAVHLADARRALEAAALEADGRREALLPLVEPRHRTDLEDYVFRTMRGQQIRPENVPELVREAASARARALESLSGSDGVRHELLWQRYALRVSEQVLEVRDQAGRPVEEIYGERDEQVRALRETLDEKTRDLLERVVMAGLVRRLQSQVYVLRQTMRGIDRLAADLRFGASRFQFSVKPRPEFERLLELLREQAVLQPALRDELRDFFQARMDDLGQARDREVPEILDYRRWFDYTLQVTSRTEGAPAELTRHRLRFGSGGEQAVPAYLLILAVASLLYEQTGARLRLLLLDEAFLGIDAGRREVLLQFADRAGVDLVVATPELDGLTPALQASSTLFIEKTPDGDVFVSDYHWERPGAQAALFETPVEPREQDLILGFRPDSGQNEA